MLRFRFLFIACVLLCFAQPVFAIRVMFDQRVFHIPGKGPFVEFVTSFDAATFAQAPSDSGRVQAHAQLTIVVSASDKIIDYRKVAVDGPLSAPGFADDFMSVERMALPYGSYDLELEICDLVAGGACETLRSGFVVEKPATPCFISDIEFVSAYRQASEVTPFTKSGYDILPYVSNYFPTSLNSLIFYAETYGSDSLFGAGNPYASSVCVIDARDNAIENCKRIKREKSAMVVPTLQTLDISDLPTGEYRIRIEVRNKDNQVVCTRERSFMRNKIEEKPVITAADVSRDEVALSFAAQFTDRDSLYEVLQYLNPVANPMEQGNIEGYLKTADLVTLQGFFYTFWKNKNQDNPESAWRDYEQRIAVAKANFSSDIKAGWQTDRGRVYLQYGKPNTRTVRSNDPDYWPFEIWHYYVTDNNLHNRRFLFYDTNLSGDMELLHSDVPGEVKNFFWKDMVRSRPMALDMSEGSSLNANQRFDPNSRDEIEDLWFNPH